MNEDFYSDDPVMLDPVTVSADPVPDTSGSSDASVWDGWDDGTTWTNDAPEYSNDAPGGFFSDLAGAIGGVVTGVVGAVGGAVKGVIGAVGDTAGKVISAGGSTASGAVGSAGGKAVQVITARNPQVQQQNNAAAAAAAAQAQQMKTFLLLGAGIALAIYLSRRE